MTWLEDPYVMTVLVEGLNAPDADVISYVAQAGPRGEHIEVMSRTDTRYLTAVDACFVQLCRTLRADQWTPVLVDREAGSIDIVPTNGGRVKHMSARVVFIIDTDNKDESGDPAKRPAKGAA